ncbi:MAG: Ppx/GppA family phosphatase [Ignavibacteriales bacterium]|nr:MAG: Ppx/GppA family phosphatase [Ignavibacteriales bacterium]
MTVASIDIGTNTVLLLIAELNLEQRLLKPIIEKSSIPRIGKGLIKGNKFPDENLLRLYTILDDYSKFIKEYNCEQVFAVATNAFRIAANGSEIVEEIQKVFGIKVDIITGETEAYYSFKGAKADSEKSGTKVVIDIGGGSTEIISGSKNSIHYRKSFPIGVVTLSERFLLEQPPAATEIESAKESIIDVFSEKDLAILSPNNAVAVAGTPTTLACIKSGLKNFDAEVIDGSQLSVKDIDKAIIQLSHLSQVEMRSNFGNIIEGREDVILAGALILKHIMELLKLKNLTVSTRGIRYGVIEEFLNKV